MSSSSVAVWAPLRVGMGASTGSSFVMTLLVECRRARGGCSSGRDVVDGRTGAAGGIAAGRRARGRVCPCPHRVGPAYLYGTTIVPTTDWAGVARALPPAHAPRGGPPPPSPNTISRIFWVRHTGCGYRSRLSLVLVFSSCATEGQLRRRSIARPSSARRSAPAFASLSWADALAALGCRQCEPGSVRSLSAVRLL